MAQSQRPADVHQDELCPPNKRYALMDANKKVDLENPLCPDESIILANILQNHPLRFSIAASSLVPWIYLGQFWHTWQEDGSKYKLKFMLERKELTLTLDDFRTIFHLPQATDNNHDHFVPALKFSKMVPFYINNLGFTLELRSTSNFKTTGLLQPIALGRISLLTSKSNNHDSSSQIHKADDSRLDDNRRNEAYGDWMIILRLLKVNQVLHKVLQDILQVSLAEQKSHEELEATQNVEKFKEHLMAEEIKKLVEDPLGFSLLSPSAVRPRDQDDPQDDAHLKGENSAKRQKTSEHGMFVFVESSSNDDVLSNGKVSQELMDEMSQTVDEAKLRKVVDEMLRQQCTSGDEHQYHIDQMQNFLKSDIMWGSKKEIIVPPYQPKPTLVTYWELGHEHKFITEIVARRANKCIVSITKSDYKNLNKNNIEDMYLLIINHKVDDYVETGLLCSLSVFIKSTVIWDRVHDFQLGVESYQQQVNLTTSTITFPSIKKYKMFSIVFEPVYGIIYKNNKKEKTVMRHQEVYKFCDATLKRVLEGLKSYNNNVKYGYVTHNLSKEDVEYLQMFPHEIEERFKYHDQMRRWEMYVNKRPLGSRRERPE
ncbi:hypothetical protein Tco_1388765 [Tanacetum coccineum]